MIGLGNSLITSLQVTFTAEVRLPKMEPSHSKIVRVAILLERYLVISVRIGARGAVFTTILFLSYILAGHIADILGWFDPPYRFLSLDGDPFFVLGGVVIGIFVVQSAGSLLLYHFLVGFEDDRSQFAVIWGFISLGFGGALLRITLPRAVGLLLELL
jgi:hypothetical protein